MGGRSNDRRGPDDTAEDAGSGVREGAPPEWDDATLIETAATRPITQDTGGAPHVLAPDYPAVTDYGKYQMLGRLAVGGMAEVFLAREPVKPTIIRHVAIKRILPQIADDETFVEMFLDEAKLAIQLNHPTICHIYDFGELEDTYFIAMEWVNGVPLGRLIKKTRDQGGIPIAIAAKIIAQIAEALNYAHQARDGMGRPMNIVHRDVSPQNIMVRWDGVIKLLDFGIAKAATQSQQTEAGVVKGKFSYMSPEQCLGRPLDARSDIFSLGACLYEALTGRPTFRRNSDLDTMRAIVHEPVASARLARPDVPLELDEIMRKALHKDPAKRFQTAGDFYVAIEKYLAAQGDFIRGMQIAQYIEKCLPGEAAAGPLVSSTPSGRALSLGTPASGSRRAATINNRSSEEAATNPDRMRDAATKLMASSENATVASVSDPDTLDVHIDIVDTAPPLTADATTDELPDALVSPNWLSDSEVVTNEYGQDDDGPTTQYDPRDLPAELRKALPGIADAETNLRGPEPEASPVGKQAPQEKRSVLVWVLFPLLAALIAGAATFGIIYLLEGDGDTGQEIGAEPEQPEPAPAPEEGSEGEEPETTAGTDTEPQPGDDSETDVEEAPEEGAEQPETATAGDTGETEEPQTEGGEPGDPEGEEAPPAAETGSIVVQTVPSGATVRISDQQHSSPATLDGFSPGTYDVTIVKAGYARWTGEVRVEAGEEATVRAILREIAPPSATPAREMGRLTLTTRPSSARVFAGSRLLGTTPFREVAVPAGTVRLRIVTSNGQTHMRSVRVRPDQNNFAFFELADN